MFILVWFENRHENIFIYFGFNIKTTTEGANKGFYLICTIKAPVNKRYNFSNCSLLNKKTFIHNGLNDFYESLIKFTNRSKEIILRYRQASPFTNELMTISNYDLWPAKDLWSSIEILVSSKKIIPISNYWSRKAYRQLEIALCILFS